MVARWSLIIKLETINGRLSTSLRLNEPTWHTDGAQPRGQVAFDLLEVHRAKLPRTIAELEMQLLPKLKAAMEGDWGYSVMGIQTVTLRDPVFTRQGDLLCELDLTRGELPVHSSWTRLIWRLKEHNLVPQAEHWVTYSKSYFDSKAIIGGEYPFPPYSAS